MWMPVSCKQSEDIMISFNLAPILSGTLGDTHTLTWGHYQDETFVIKNERVFDGNNSIKSCRHFQWIETLCMPF